MSMKMNYVNMNMPTDYINELLNKGVEGGIKANAFMRYFFDKEVGTHKNSLRFYAETWQVSKSTVGRWIKEFREEIELFDAHWYLRNQNKNHEQYTSAKKDVGQMGQSEWDRKNSSEAQSKGVCESDVGQMGQSAWDKYLNSIEEEEGEEFFTELEMIASTYANFTNRLGKEADRVKAYKSIRSKISLEDLLLAINKYFKDSSINNVSNLPQFLSNKLFFAYVDRAVRVKTPDGSWLLGRYVANKKLINYNDGRSQPVGNDVFVAWLARGDIEYVGRVV